MFSSITSAFTNSAWSLGGLAVSAAVTYATGESPGARLASGFAMTITGATALLFQLLSGTPKGPAASNARKITMLSSACITACGLYNVATGISGLLKQANTPQYDPVLYGKLVEQFRNCSLANDLWESSGYFKIEPTHFPLAFMQTGSRVVGLPNDTQDQNLGSLASMLCHLKPKFAKPTQAIAWKVHKMNMDFPAYKEAMLHLAWPISLCQHTVAKGCIESANWPEAADLFPCHFEGPDARWATPAKLIEDYACDPAHKLHLEYLYKTWSEIIFSNPKARQLLKTVCPIK